MADIKIQANGNIDYWWIPANGLANPEAPLDTEINAGIRLTPATAWDGTTFPNATDSNDNDDRSLEDAGNVVERGYEQMEGESTFFYPKDLTDPNDPKVKAFQAFKKDRVTGYLVTRVLQRATAPGTTPATAGQIVSVFKVITDTFTVDTEGESAYKFTVGFLPQGVIHVHTLVTAAVPLTITVSGTGPTKVGAHGLLTATISGVNWTQGVEWVSSNPSVATVSPNGVVTGVSAGTATITASHAGATTSTGVSVTLAP